MLLRYKIFKTSLSDYQYINYVRGCFLYYNIFSSIVIVYSFILIICLLFSKMLTLWGVVIEEH